MDTYIQFRTDLGFKKRVLSASKKLAKRRGKPERGALSDFIRDAVLEKITRDGL